MDGPDEQRQSSGFRERTGLSEARERLLGSVEPLAAESVPIEAADGRVLAAPVAAERSVPHYERAAMDGYAVQAAETVGASNRSPVVLAEDSSMRSGAAVRVHTGSPIPEGADAVVTIEACRSVAGTLEITEPVPAGANVAPIGEDVTEGQPLFDSGHRLRPSDLGLLRASGHGSVPVHRDPTVGVIPTGDEVVESEPDTGEVLETNGLTLARLIERWGGSPAAHEIVPDEDASLRAALLSVQSAADVVVTSGGSSVGERDRVPEILDESGDVLVHGVAMKPGHPVALGVIEGTPVLALPGYPVACLVTAVQFLRPVLAHTQATALDPVPTITATLERKLPSEPGVRTFARVTLDGSNDAVTATPTHTSGAGILSSVALSDGWVVVAESREGIPDGEPVTVELWEAWP